VDDSPSRDPAIPPHRLVALGDGVFAIVMTLLVFQLAVPSLDEGESLAGALAGMWPDFAVYVLSFLVLGVFWVIHHVLFDIIERYDTTLIWLNIAYLMFAALVPFSTDLFTTHGVATTTAIFYGSNMIAVYATGWSIFGYATRDRRLVSDDFDVSVIRGGTRMGVAYMAFMVPSIAIAVLSPTLSFTLYGLMVLAFMTATVVGRVEVVVLWRRAQAGVDGDRPAEERLVDA
jgi:uncharacterized membrane protein